MIKLAKLAEQQKKEITVKIKIRDLEQTPKKKTAETFEPITKNLEEVDESTENIEDVRKKSDSEDENQQVTVPVAIDINISEKENDDPGPKLRAIPNTSKSRDKMRDTSGPLMKSHNSSRIEQYYSSGKTNPGFLYIH